MANNKFMRELEKKASNFEREFYRKREPEQPSFAAYQKNCREDEITVAAAKKMLGIDESPAPDEPTVESEPTTSVSGDFQETVATYRDRLEEILAEKNAGPPSAEDHVWRRRGVADPSTDIADFKLVLRLEPLMDDETTCEFELLDSKLDSERVKPGIYFLTVTRTDADNRPWVREVTEARPVRIEDEHCDLSELTPLSDEELRAALAPPAPPPPAPEAPQFVRTQRQPGDTARRVGFTLGAHDVEAPLRPEWSWFRFHIASPTVIGKISAGMEVPYANTHLQLRLFNPFGELLLETKLSGSNGLVSAQFDEIRLEPGDYLVAFTAGGGTAKCSGSAQNPNCGLFESGLPQKPRLDDLRATAGVMMPRLTFTAR